MRRTLLKLATPIVVLVGAFLLLAMLPEWFPDHGVMSAAIYEGDVERVRVLLERGADPNSRRAVVSILSRFLSRTGYQSDSILDFSEQTPLLIEALNREQYEIAELLLDAGANPNVSEDGRSAVDRAREAGQTSLVEKLQSRQ